MAEKVCSSLTEETKMTKRRKEEVGDLALPVDEAVANGPSRQGSSQKRWACTNCGGHDRSFDIIGATHKETCLLELSRNLSFSLDALIILHFSPVLHS